MSTLQFSPLIIGTMRLGNWGAQYSTQELENFIDACVDLDLLDFDHADIYGNYTSEGEFGAVLKRRPDLRNKIRNTTKCGIKMMAENRPNHKIKSYDSSAKHIRWSVENSLSELGVESLDLLLLHRPDILMNAAEIVEVFTTLQKEGKVQQFGASNFTSSQFDLIHQHFPLVNHQIEISLMHTAPFVDGTLDHCQKNKITPTAWSPLAGGRFFKSVTLEKDQDLKIKKVIDEIGEEHICSRAAVLFAWLKNHPAGIVPVTGSSKIERIKEAKAAMEITLTREEWYRLWEVVNGEVA